MSVRRATVDDIESILAMAEFFVGESAYGMEFDADASRAYLDLILNHHEVAVFVSHDLQAGAIAAISQDWCKRPLCYVEKLFLMPGARGSGVARELIAAVIEFSESFGCSHVFSSATAGMGPRVERLYVNLFRKFGFTECGQILVKGMQ